MLHRRICFGLGALVVALGTTVAALRGGEKPADSIQDDFEGPRPAWKQEETDASVRLLAHERSTLAAHSGRTSERFQFEARAGSAFFFSYALPNVPLTDALQAGIFVRANRAGLQLLGRVVLPADTDPDTGQPSFVTVAGPLYERVDRWQKLELLDLRAAAERQARVVRASTKRPVKLEGAYLDRLVVNIYGSPGLSEVFLDDLSLAPVPPALVAARSAAPPPIPSPNPPGPPATRVGAGTSPSTGAGPRLGPAISYEGGRLRKDGHDWLFTAVRAPGTDLGALRRAGFDVLIDDVDADPKRLQDALAKGFLLMPDLGPKVAEGAKRAVAAAAAFPYRGSVAFWDLGDGLGRARDVNEREGELELIRQAISGLHGLGGATSRLTTATVEGEFRNFARPPRSLDLVGVRPNSWASLMEPSDTYLYLTQRRSLSVQNAGGLFWCWVPAGAPAGLQNAIWGDDVPTADGVPLVQPEQLRLNTYIALAAGYRGIAFEGNADLTRNPGQMLLTEMALLNEEIDLFESVLANSADPIPFYSTFLPDPPQLPPPGSRIGQKVKPPQELPPHGSIRAAAIGTRDRKGVLLVVTDLSGGAQIQPPQMAINDLMLTVIAPEGAQACEISPGGLRWLDRERVPGGTRVKIPQFGVTALVLFTTDLAAAEELEAKLARVRPQAVQLAIDEARLQFEWVRTINGQLVAEGHPLKNAKELLSQAEKGIEDARDALAREDYAFAWTNARIATRPLRILMQGHVAQAVEALNKTAVASEDPDASAGRDPDSSTPAKKAKKPFAVVTPATSSAPCVAFNTLPQHFRFLDWIKQQEFGKNRVPSGSFEQPNTLAQAGWVKQSYQYDDVTVKVVPTKPDPVRKSRAMKLSVGPTPPKTIDDLPPFLDHPAASFRAPAVEFDRETYCKISVLVKKLLPSVAGAGGVIIHDSIGGELLQYRSSAAMIEWTRVVIYRRVPADTPLTVTLGLAGYGDVYFDDFKIEPVEPASRTRTPDLARLPRLRGPSNPTATATRPTVPTRTNQ